MLTRYGQIVLPSHKPHFEKTTILVHRWYHWMKQVFCLFQHAQRVRFFTVESDKGKSSKGTFRKRENLVRRWYTLPNWLSELLRSFDDRTAQQG